MGSRPNLESERIGTDCQSNYGRHQLNYDRCQPEFHSLVSLLTALASKILTIFDQILATFDRIAIDFRSEFARQGMERTTKKVIAVVDRHIYIFSRASF